jgi:aspartyl-tRNA(Asn)/glutamyl-tRNA(Gln) amidotransferase subunit B
MEYEAIIGMEVHAQLTTASKMFCGCSADYAAAPPNTHVCPVCLGMPGVLPVTNRRAVEHTVMTALALHCEIPPTSKFDRKNYPYPDLMKGYQISQYDLPLSRDGWLEIEMGEERRRIGIRRVHLEEDTAKLTHHHGDGGGHSLVDVNRSGVPLMEIVSEPEIRSPEEARLYVAKLRQILVYLGVSSGNLEEGSMRLEANVSLRPQGSDAFGTKVEIKNMNSLRAVRQALEYEIERQTQALEAGEALRQETRGWDEEAGRTVVQRVKESAEDYRYFPEPDLPPLILSRQWVEEIRAKLPELPDAKRDRFMSQYRLSRYDATVLTTERETADYFETLVEEYPHPKAAANWIAGQFFRLLRSSGYTISTSPVGPEHLAELLQEIDAGNVSISAGRTVLEEMFATGKSASQVIAAEGLVQISDEEALRQVVEEVIGANPAAVADFRSGKEQALRFLMGQVMKATRGKANPRLVSEFLRAELTK